ncbi:hypothetical protein SAMN05444407_104236 [Chryseobacterium contaminans]|uniref:Uncharacterized protein n=1 Tax=Chryseobacterium contaminans TaxID=1423959 RepID=A0A1M7B4U2_9FLAO|nr:hypothetical protein SAMN05444407_104236 [Chryseobacterium contaminans]
MLIKEQFLGAAFFWYEPFSIVTFMFCIFPHKEEFQEVRKDGLL